jgi:hypothetical protein
MSINQQFKQNSDSITLEKAKDHLETPKFKSDEINILIKVQKYVRRFLVTKKFLSKIDNKHHVKLKRLIIFYF